MATRLNALREAKAQKVAAMRALSTAAGSGTMAEDDHAKFEALRAEVDRLNVAIAQEEALVEHERSTATPALMPTLEPEPARRQREGNPAATFSRFGDFLSAVAHAGNPDRDAPMDPRLRQRFQRFNAETGEPIPGAIGIGMNEAIPAEGGFLVPHEMVAGLMTPVFDGGEILRRVTKQPVGPNARGLSWNQVKDTSRATGSRWGGMRVFWLDEGGLKTASRMEFEQRSMTLRKLAGLLYATDELLEDAVGLEALIREAFRQEFTFVIEDNVLWGTGGARMLGILNSPGTIDVAKVSGQAAATVRYENILAMWSRLGARWRPNSVWLINQDVEPGLFGMQDPAGNLIFLPGGVLGGEGIRTGGVATLMGRPVIPTEYNETLGTRGDILLADLSEYLVITKNGLEPQMAVSIHVRFVYDETAFRFVVRIDGQPRRASPVTPYKGTMTVSPFVTLATRA